MKQRMGCPFEKFIPIGVNLWPERPFRSGKKSSGEDWPRSIVKYLQSDIDEEALLKLAIDDDKRTEVHGFHGLDLFDKGKSEVASKHFRWVKNKGNPSSTEYTIPFAKRERLEKKK